MSMKHSGVTYTRNLLAAACFGTSFGAVLLSACSASNASDPDQGGAGNATHHGTGGSANPAGGFAGGNVGGFGNGNVGGFGNGNVGGFGNGNVGGFGNGGSDPSGGVPGSGGDFNSGSGGDFNSGSGGSGPKVFTDPNATNPDRNKVAGGQVCERLSTIQCAAEAYCCDAPGRSYDECKQAAKDYCVNSLYLDAVTANPITGYDGVGAEAIFLAYEGYASNCDPNVTAWGASLQGLRGLAKGTRASGANCKPGIADVTKKPVAAANLASCLNPETTACYPAAPLGTNWTCSARGNGACFADTNCTDGLYCDNPQLLPAGSTCRQRKGDGTPCAQPNECGSLLCKQHVCAGVNQQTAFCLRN
jgi:hypothetical protein